MLPRHDSPRNSNRESAFRKCSSPLLHHPLNEPFSFPSPDRDPVHRVLENRCPDENIEADPGVTEVGNGGDGDPSDSSDQREDFKRAHAHMGSMKFEQRIGLS